jgi:hypothetical protein
MTCMPDYPVNATANAFFFSNDKSSLLQEKGCAGKSQCLSSRKNNRHYKNIKVRTLQQVVAHSKTVLLTRKTHHWFVPMVDCRTDSFLFGNMGTVCSGSGSSSCKADCHKAGSVCVLLEISDKQTKKEFGLHPSAATAFLSCSFTRTSSFGSAFVSSAPRRYAPFVPR